MTDLIEEAKRELAATVGCTDPQTFVNSPKQMREFFQPERVGKHQWRLNDGTLVGSTKSGASASLDQTVLRTVAHPASAQILGLRKAIKLRDTFLKGHIIGSADKHGKVHTTFNQTRNDADAGTVTGRLSSTDPALQQITNRDKKNAEILRSLFLPDPHHHWFRADYSQIDFRMAAHLINDDGIIAAYKADPKTDYHQVVSDMTGIPRNAAYAGAPNTKTLNLSLAFGAGPGKTAFSMGMPYTISEYKGRMMYVPGPEAEAVFNKYHSRIPGVKMFSKKAQAVARSRGYVKTMLGRRLRFLDNWHKAAGLLFQANAADVNKFGLLMADRAIRDNKLDARLMLTVHDELGASVSCQRDADIIGAAFTNFNGDGAPLRFRVPVTASFGMGPNWWLASQ
jgi:DNA polymerase I